MRRTNSRVPLADLIAHPAAEEFFWRVRIAG
jgi:hypothetical protein